MLWVLREGQARAEECETERSGGPVWEGVVGGMGQGQKLVGESGGRVPVGTPRDMPRVGPAASDQSQGDTWGNWQWVAPKPRLPVGPSPRPASSDSS